MEQAPPDLVCCHQQPPYVSERILPCLLQLEPLLRGIADLGGRFPGFACCPECLHVGSELGTTSRSETSLPAFRFGRLLGSVGCFGRLAAFLPLGGFGVSASATEVIGHLSALAISVSISATALMSCSFFEVMLSKLRRVSLVRRLMSLLQ